MPVVFADSFYWIALLNPRDSAHASAVAVGKTLPVATIVTTDEVLTEFLNYYAERGPYLRTAAARLIERMHTDARMRILPQTRETFVDALHLYRARVDKGYSLTDCASMQTMRRTGMTEVLTGDRHFAQEGFICLLDDLAQK